MRRDELVALHNMFHRDNLESILSRGVLSHRRAEALAHRSIADPGVQSRRATVTVPPSGRPLHSYANLYVNCRNIVTYRFKRDLEDAGGRDTELCVIEVSLNVLDLPGVIVTDRNAASSPRWMTPDVGIDVLDRDDVFSRYWDGRDHWQRMCAEVLVPNLVPPEFITRIFVSRPSAVAPTEAICGETPVEVQGHPFFRTWTPSYPFLRP